MARGRRPTRNSGRRAEKTRLRLAGSHDTALLANHRRRMWEELRQGSAAMFDRADREYRSFLRHARKRRRFAAFVVETDAGVPVASGAIWLQEQQPRPELEPGPLPYLMSMFTEPDHRGHGHASEVVRAAVAWCRERGYPRLILHAAPGGRKIYRRVGFRRTWEMVLELGKGPSSRRRRTTRAGR